jgi:hypothetical protein
LVVAKLAPHFVVAVLAVVVLVAWAITLLIPQGVAITLALGAEATSVGALSTSGVTVMAFTILVFEIRTDGAVFFGHTAPAVVVNLFCRARALVPVGVWDVVVRAFSAETGVIVAILAISWALLAP